MPLSANTDRELLDLISTLTDEGQTLPLKEVVEDFGPERVARIIRDGFVAVFPATDREFWEMFDQRNSDWPFLEADQAIELVRLDPVPLDFRIRQASGALALEEAPNLVFDSAADKPDAIAEVRARHGLA